MTAPSRVIVTGAAQGIGRAVALRAAADGAHIAVWDSASRRRRGDRATVPGTRARRRAPGKSMSAPPIRSKPQPPRSSAQWGKPDGLVNNAGIFPRARALDMALAEWEQVLRVNLTGTFLCARAVARLMKDAGGGVIVNMASGRALAGAANGAHYSASKGAIIALTKSLALDWAPYGIRVNCVIPG